MANHAIDTSGAPMRLFRSDFLEFFTHVHPAAVLAIWAPATVAFLVVAVVNRPAGAWVHIPLGFLAGLFIWTFAEYTLHRFLFHMPPRTPAQERISFLFHGIHHAQPMVKTRLVMPPAVSLPLAALFYGLFWVVLARLLPAAHWLAPTFAGFIAGYLAYDMLHYTSHHFPFKSRYLKFVKRYHMNHHFKTPNARFGVSSPLWDRVFGTYPE